MSLFAHLKKRIPRYTLRDAVFSSKYTSYIVYRMRFFILVSVLTLAVEIVELYLIKGAVSAILIEKIVFMRLTIALTTAGWWGCLEILREYVRGRNSFSDRPAINLSISHWLTLSVGFAAIVVVLTMGYFTHQKFEFSPFENLIFQLYVLGFTLACFLEFWLETYRSGALAIRRIYRPLTSVIAPGLLSLIILALLWHFLGVLGLPFAFMLGRFIDGGVKAYFIRNTYKNLKLHPLCMPKIKAFFNFCWRMPKFNFVASYLAGVALSIETLLFLIFLSEMQNYPDFVLYLFILRLIYHAFSNWGLSFFYYDFKKMFEEAYPPFYKQFLKNLMIASFIISAIFYCMTIPVTYTFYRDHFFLYALVTLVFFIFLSIFSYMEIHTFSQNRYADLIASSVIGVIIFLLGDHFFHSFIGISISLLVALISIVLLLLKSWLPTMSTINSVKKQSIYTLLYNLKNVKSGFVMSKIKTNPRAGRKVLNNFLSHVALSMDPRGWICPLRSNEFIFIETKRHTQLNLKSLAEEHSDVIKSYRGFAARARVDCLDFIYGEFKREVKDNPFYNRLKPGIDLDSQIIRLFKESFPEDREFDLLHVNFIYDQPDKNQIYASIEASYLVPLAIMRELSYSSALLFDSVPILFLIKKEGKKFTKLFNWNKFIHFENLDKFRKMGYKVL